MSPNKSVLSRSLETSIHFSDKPQPMAFLRMQASPAKCHQNRFSSSTVERQAALEVTAKYCHNELEDYGSCVSSKPGTWQQDCHEKKVKVAQCTSSHPVIRKIRTQCAEPFAAFEQCLKLNQSSVQNCSKHVTEFLQCAESVKLPHQTQN